MKDVSEQFVRNLTDSQQALFLFILAMLPDPVAARDVLQETNIVLWRKAEELRDDSKFMAWACQVARFEVAAHLRDSARDRLVTNDQLLETLASQAERRTEDSSERMLAFEACFRQLTEHQRELVSERYAPGGSVQEMARQRGQSPGALSVALTKIRHKLKKCIQQRLAQGDQT